MDHGLTLHSSENRLGNECGTGGGEGTLPSPPLTGERLGMGSRSEAGTVQRLGKKRMGRKSISKALRFRILARDGFRCRYCGAAAPDVELRVDHFIAKADGGSDREENLVTACFDCNAGKSDRRISGITAPIVTVTSRRGRRRTERDPLSRSPHLVRKGEPHHHVLNTGVVIETGEVWGNDQAARLWCESHQTYEWHRVPRRFLGRVGTLEAVGPVLK
jgi:hypothetical protein